jgi:hypothetical protein
MDLVAGFSRLVEWLLPSDLTGGGWWTKLHCRKSSPIVLLCTLLMNATSVLSRASHSLLRYATALTSSKFFVKSTIFHFVLSSLTWYFAAFQIKLHKLKSSVRFLLSVIQANRTFEWYPIRTVDIGASVQMGHFWVSDFTWKYLWLLRILTSPVFRYSNEYRCISESPCFRLQVKGIRCLTCKVL